jgi:hypothetical protein
VDWRDPDEICSRLGDNVILKFRNGRWERIQEMTVERMEVMGGRRASLCQLHLARWDSM